MLLALNIHNFVLIDSLELRLEPGFNVITGETGAGKSIMIDALNLVLGRRARPDMVRQGAHEATVDALFAIAEDSPIKQLLEDAGVPCDDELVVRRVVQASGRSRAYLNGRLCTAREIAALAPELADVTSQHESVALADGSRHLDYLDRYAKLSKPRAALAKLVGQLSELSARLRSLRGRERNRCEREAFLRFQLNAIREVDPQPGELDSLELERSKLKHAESLAESTRDAATQLDQDSEGICDRLGRVAAQLATGASLDPDLSSVSEAIQACWQQLQEATREVAHYSAHIESDPARLEEIGARLFRIEGLLRQHGPTFESMLDTARELETELIDLASYEAQIPALASEEQALLAHAGTRAGELSKQRQRVAIRLGKAISRQLANLGMGRARVEVEVKPLGEGVHDPDGLYIGNAKLSPTGIDRVRFLIAPNRGVEPRALGRIASGGELSRALLALKGALAAEDTEGGFGVQVFDEVDSGIGGETADRVGHAIAALSARRQVLCITHMAAIAAYADAHFVVMKDDVKGKTITRIQRVEGAGRSREIARMLTGSKATKASLKAARELLATATLTDAA